MTKIVMLVCLTLALLTALTYVLLILDVLQLPEDMQPEGVVPTFFYIVPAGYVIGGLLILLKKRWLLITGAVFNAIPILVFYLAYAGRPDIMLSAPGLISKIAQVLLEAGLIYLIVTCQRQEPAIK